MLRPVVEQHNKQEEETDNSSVPMVAVVVPIGSALAV